MLNGEGFKDWASHTHPQLGEVEVGGWRTKYTWRNPPPGRFLEEEVAKTYRFSLVHASLLPEIEITETSVEKIDDEIYRIQVKVVNNGFQSTALTQMAEKEKYAKPVIAEISDNVKVLSPKPWIDLGVINGRAEKLPGLIRPTPAGEGHAKTAEWVIKTSVPVDVKVKVSSEKAGEIEKVIKVS
jgi:hypothetical protein